MCTCASCSYTDDFKDKGFAAWPRGNPTGRKARAEYAGHVRYGQQWGKDRVPEFPGGVPTGPLRYVAPRQRDPGLDRTYPQHPDGRQGWTSTAAYVEAFIAQNNYLTLEKLEKRDDYRAMVKLAEQAARKREKELDRIRKPQRPVSRLMQLARELRKAA